MTSSADDPRTDHLADDASTREWKASGLPAPADPAGDLDLLRRLHEAWPAPSSTAPTVKQTAPQPTPPPGDTPSHFGHYHLVRPLGQGGFGLVYLAHDSALGRLVALKVPRAGTLCSPDLRQRFLREGQLAAGLDHPHLVPVHEAGEVGPICYIASAYVPGGNLAGWLAAHRDRPMDVRLAARLVATLARAIHHAHQRGVIHRDLKPGNVLLQEVDPAQNPDGWPADLGVPRICDFGLARHLDGAAGDTRTGDVLGTPEYMAPEQAAGRTREVGVATDVYALGAILYRCLTGRPPHTDDSKLALLQRVLQEQPVPPKRLRRDVPADLQTVCLRCLQKEPGSRYPSAEALAQDLEAWLGGRPIQARRHGPLEGLLLWARREPRLAAVSCLALAALLALPALAVWFWMRTGELSRAAEIHQFYRLLSAISEREARRDAGWTWENVRELRTAAGLAPAAEHQAELRSALAACLGAVDLRQRHSLAEGFLAEYVLFSPDGRRLALVQRIAYGPAPLRVRLFDPTSFEELPGLTFPSNPAWQLLNARGEVATAAGFSSCGRWLAVGTRSGNLHVWDLRQPAPRAVSWQGHPTKVRKLAFAPGGSVLYSVGDGGEARRWSSAPRWTRRPLHQPEPIANLFTLGSGQLQFIGNEGRLFTPEGDAILAGVHDLRHQGEHAAGSPDGRLFAYRTGGVVLHDCMSGRPLAEFPGKGEGLAFSPDGRLLAGISPSERNLRVWDVASGRVEVALTVPGGLGSVAFSPDGRSLAVNTEGRTLVYEVGRSGTFEVAAQHGADVRDVAFVANGGALACLAYLEGQQRIQEVTLWPLADPFPLSPARRGCWRGGSADDAHRLAAHPDRPGTFFTCQKRLRFWDFAAGRFADLGPFERHGDLGCGPGGRLWAACHHEVRSGTAADEPPAPALTNSVPDQHVGHTFYSVAAGRDWTAAGRRDGRVFVFRAPEARLERASEKLCDSPVTALALAGDERTAAVGTELGRLLLVELPSCKVVRELPAHRAQVVGVAFVSPDVLVTASRDRTVRLMTLDGRTLLRWTTDKPVERLALSPDRTRLAVAVENERAVRLWRLGRLARRLDELGLPLGLPLAESDPGPAGITWAEPRAPSSSRGLKREVFADLGCSFKVGQRYVQSADIRGREGKLPHPALGPAFGSIRWSGWLRPPEAGTYDLHLRHEAGARLWVDGKVVVDRLLAGPGEAQTSVRLDDRPQAFRLELVRWDYPCLCRLRWRPEGHGKFKAIPETALSHDLAAARDEE